MRGSRFLPALATGSLLIAACGGGSANDGAAATSAPAAESSPATDAAAAPSTDVPAADTAPAGDAADDGVTAPASLQFTAPLVGGGELDAATLAGKPTLFWFWAPTWSSCNREAPSVEAAAKKFAGEVNFVGVAWTGDDDDFQGFIDKHSLTFPQISDNAGVVFNRFDVAFQPAMSIVKADGSIESIAGAMNGDLLDQIISEAWPFSLPASLALGDAGAR
jgi:peroxiredoxin